MNRAVRHYLREVKKRLCCPSSLKKEFLRQLTDELILFCSDRETANFLQLTEHFGAPEDVADDFLAELDPGKRNRYACRQMKLAYLTLAAVSLLSISMIAGKAGSYLKTSRFVTESRTAETYIHKNGTACSMFWVRTCFRGDDVYWEYHSCDNQFYLTGRPPEETFTDPYATEIYTTVGDTVTHWTFGQDHRFWIKVHDV